MLHSAFATGLGLVVSPEVSLPLEFRGVQAVTATVVVNYASHVVPSAAVDTTTRNWSLLSCHRMSFVTAYAHAARVASVSAHSDSLG